MIKAQGISKSFGALQALRNLSFEIEKGEFVALLGVNGAGKTTLIRILSALTRPTRGEVFIAGYSFKKNPNKLRSHLGVVSHFTYLYPDLSASENLLFYGKMYGVPDLSNRIKELLERVDLYHRRHDLVRTFSRGMQQRLSLARAILHSPDILLLDEPFTGLDVNATDLLTKLLRNFIGKEVTVLLTTHQIDFALSHAHRVLILRNGVIHKDAPASEMTREQIAQELLPEARHEDR